MWAGVENPYIHTRTSCLVCPERERDRERQASLIVDFADSVSGSNNGHETQQPTPSRTIKSERYCTCTDFITDVTCHSPLYLSPCDCSDDER